MTVLMKFDSLCCVEAERDLRASQISPTYAEAGEKIESYIRALYDLASTCL